MQCAASIICIDTDGRVLLGMRSDNHKWGYSGGSLDIDEHVEDCAKRELFEEMGLIPDSLEYEKANIDEILVYIAKEDKNERHS